MSDAPDPRDPVESVRSSRQELVVPPRQSNWTVVLGGIASGLAGFGLVFGLGIGRSRHPAGEHPRPVAVAGADHVRADQPPAPVNPPLKPLPAPEDDLLPPPADVSVAEFEPTVGDADDRYAARVVSHDDLPAAAVPPPRMSRFSSPDLPPLDPEPLAAADAEAESEDPTPAVFAAPELRVNDQSADADRLPSDAAEQEPIVAAAVPEAAFAPETEGEPPVASEPPSPAIVPAASAVARSVEPTTSRSIEVSQPVPDPVAEPRPEPAAVANPANPFAQAAPPPGPTAAAGPTHTPRDLVAPAAATTLASAVAVESAADDPAPAALPFAAAPPLGPAPPSGFSEPSTIPAADRERASGSGATGQGVPGPLQLEGIQTPQMAVEKRGPKEIQVGKAARYEILVRNVGSATAHDVMLRDAVPRGTSLIATTPPATPLTDGPEPQGDLVWTLGVLPPGGEVRVLMELMPEEEGEIGSIASVSFRADATLRSRSTKPALEIDCPEPDAVRIGRDMQVTLTVRNPGSGTATGVVLEAFLPESVSHRAGSELEFDVGQLRPGESKTIDLVLGTRGPGLQPARLVARADGGIEEILQVPLEVTAPTLELAIDMPARRFLQRPATCRIAMVNAGTASARAVELAAQLPPGMKFVRANNAGWHDERTHRVLWNLEELPPGETGSVEAVVMPVQAGPQRITAAARSSDGPSAQVAHLCSVEGLAALSFQVVDSEDPIEVDGLTEYVIRVSNDGTKAATGVRVAATLLGDLEPVEATGPGGHRVENLAIEFEPLAKLGPGEEAVYRVRVRGRRAGDQRIQVQLVSEDHPTPIIKEEITSVYDDR
jgi:uncharacterized repeat protein (TIGR01451 family)